MVHLAPRAALALLCFLMAASSVTARPHPSTTTFPPQPQLITLAPPVPPTATLDPSFEGIVSGIADEDQRAPMDDDDPDGTEDNDPDRHPDPSLASTRGHYLYHYRYTKRRSGAFDLRPLSRKGKTRLRKNNDSSIHGKRRSGNGNGGSADADADADWRVWRSQYARQQQWRRCRTLQFGPCPDDGEYRG